MQKSIIQPVNVVGCHDRNVAFLCRENIYDIQQTRGSDAISRIVVFATVVTLIMPENIGLTFLNPA